MFGRVKGSANYCSRRQRIYCCSVSGGEGWKAGRMDAAKHPFSQFRGSLDLSNKTPQSSSLHYHYPKLAIQIVTMLTHDDFLLKHLQTRAQRLKNPSRRTPDRETDFNNADNIERQLQEDGHQIWGWVIYRCTYASHEEWAEFMSRLRYYIEDTLRYDNALDMQSSLDYHVFEDPELFDGMHPSNVRDHFEQWVATAPQQEQGDDKFTWRSQRYTYCLHVDQEALRSVISGPVPPEDNLGNGFVNLVCRLVLGGMRPEHTSGRDERDHCWMRITYQDLMATWYCRLRWQGSWRCEYRIPPEVARP